MVLTVTEDTPADMLAGSMELLVQLPREYHLQTQRVTVQRSTPMMDLLVQITTAHKLTASSYTLQAIGERGMILPHQPNTPIGALDALQVKLLPKQGTLLPRKAKQVNQPFETTFRLQVHLPRNQLYVSRVSPKMNLGEILEEVCREKDLDKNKYELHHPTNLETLDLSLSLQDYHLQEVTLYAKQGRTLSSALSTQDIMALQRQEERRRQQAKQGVFGFVFKKSKEGSLSTDSLGERSASPARSDETGRSTSPLQPPARPQRKRRPAPKPPLQDQAEGTEEGSGDSSKDKVVINHSRNSSDSSGYHEASVLSDNLDSSGRLPETLPRRNKAPLEVPRKLAQTSQSSKSLSNLASVPGTLSHGISSTSLSSTGLRKKRVAPPPPVTRPLSSAISTQGLERIVDSEESLTSDIDPSKPPSDIGVASKANSDIEERPKASSDIGVTTGASKLSGSIDFTKSEIAKTELESKSNKPKVDPRSRLGSANVELPGTEPEHPAPVEDAPVDSRVLRKRAGEPVPLPKPRKAATLRPEVSKRKLAPPSPLITIPNSDTNHVDCLLNASTRSSTRSCTDDENLNMTEEKSCIKSVGSSNAIFFKSEEKLDMASNCSTSEDEIFMTPGIDQVEASFDYSSVKLEVKNEIESMNLTLKDDIDGVNYEAESNIDGNKENIDISLNQNSTVAKHLHSSIPIKSASSQEKKLCAVISTMPKCDHLNTLSVNNTIAQYKEQENLKEPKRSKILRTASKSNDFEINPLEKQKRHLTSHAEDIMFALNLNVTSNIDPLSEKEKQDTGFQGVGEEKSYVAVGPSDTDLSETDVLLQKVSDTLSNSLPVASSNEKQDSPVKTKLELANFSQETNQKNKKNTEYINDPNMNTSTTNITVNSQQDTSDYISAADEDLSLTEWEYQLPAPPSAFRDSSSPVFDNFEMITPSPESFRDSDAKEIIETLNNKDLKNIPGKIERQESKDQTKESEVRKEQKEKLYQQRKPDLIMKKEVIYELENKIGTLPQVTKDVDSRKTANLSIPKIAPVDNTLSNFTITTYSKPKNVNIFAEVKEQSREKNCDERFIKSFATLSRNKRSLNENEDKSPNEFVSGTHKSNNKKLEPKIQVESVHRYPSGSEKSNIQRSKSYISIGDKLNYQGNIYEDQVIKTGKNLEMGDAGMKKATSISNLNVTTPKNNEQFSQWRDNILKRQENPTKEKQLQSLQVLKSILPQLKNAQQAEENVPKDLSNTVLSEKTKSGTASNEHSTVSNVVSIREPQTAPSNKIESEPQRTLSQTNPKRYIYSGPPTINLGSWSERPSVNVQIKTDTDYKFGIKQANSKTIVNINGIKDEVNNTSEIDSSNKIQKCKFEDPDKLNKKLITHTVSGFKKPISNKINSSEPKIINDKPIVTGVELKKNFIENKQDDNVIDTTPVNFKEIAKAFGQEVCHRPKPKRSSTIQCSNPSLENDCNKHNGHTSNQTLANAYQNTMKPKKFTSIVGIPAQSQSNNVMFRNGLNMKKNQPLPIAKGFKLSNIKILEGQNHENQTQVLKGSSKEGIKEDGIKRLSKESTNGPPRPPTMPVITGVTLKSARPKSMPVQMDQRDILLESIRNFGGRENLKSAAERC